jgi:hypothetical protein
MNKVEFYIDLHLRTEILTQNMTKNYLIYLKGCTFKYQAEWHRYQTTENANNKITYLNVFLDIQ